MNNSEMSGILTLISNLTTTVQDLERSVNGGHGGRGYDGRGCGRGGCGGLGGCDPNNKNIFGCHPRWRCIAISHYCWSHGECNHISGDCSNPLSGHQNTATFDNRMNGCDHYCQPVTDNNNNTHDNLYINSIFKYNDSTDFIIAKADIGATSNYWSDCDINLLSNLEKVDRPSVTLPSNSVIKSTEEGNIPLLPLLSSNATKASVIPGLKSALLISLGQIAEDDRTILLDKSCLVAVKQKQIVLIGKRNIYDGL